MRGAKLVVSLIAAAGLPPLAPAAASASTVDWKPCKEIAGEWSPEDTLSECAMVTVPVDYAKPDGRTIGIAVSPVTPIGWTWAMRQRIGGAVLTIEDDHHGSLRSLPCASKAVEFFSIGKTSAGSCSGLPIPAPTDHWWGP